MTWKTLVYRHYPDEASMDGVSVTVNRDRSVRVWKTLSHREHVADTEVSAETLAQLDDLAGRAAPLGPDAARSLEVQGDGVVHRLEVPAALHALFDAIAASGRGM